MSRPSMSQPVAAMTQWRTETDKAREWFAKLERFREDLRETLKADSDAGKTQEKTGAKKPKPVAKPRSGPAKKARKAQ